MSTCTDISSKYEHGHICSHTFIPHTHNYAQMYNSDSKIHTHYTSQPSLPPVLSHTHSLRPHTSVRGELASD